MPVAPFPAFDEDLEDKVILAVAPLLGAGVMTNEAGVPISVPIGGAFKGDRAAFPQVTVSVNLGETELGFGLSAVKSDPVTGARTFGFHAEQTEVIFDVQARSEAERRYIASAIRSGIPAAYSVNSDGTLAEATTVVQLKATAGFVCQRFAKSQYPKPDRDELTPEGSMVFHAILTLIGTLAVQWTTTGEPANAGMTITTSTFTVPVMTDPPIVIAATP